MCELSVLVIAFNNESYIDQCLNSIISQKFTPSYEIVIAEDCSTDSTKEKICEWHDRFKPESLRCNLIFNKINNGVTVNFANGVSNCKGQFVVPIAGDDYFINDYVLTHLHDYISKHPEAAIYSTNSVQFFEIDEKIKLGNNKGVFLKVNTRDLLYGNPVGGAVIFRNVITDFPSLYLTSEAEDRQMWYMLSRFGEIHINPLFVGKFYRRHGASITMQDKRSSEEKIINRLKDNEKWRSYLDWVGTEDFIQAQKFHLRRLFREQLKKFKFVSAINTWFRLNSKFLCVVLLVV